MIKILSVMLALAGISFASTEKSNVSNIEVSFIGSSEPVPSGNNMRANLIIIVETASNAFSELGFNCSFLNNDIVLKIGTFQYRYDENEQGCTVDGNKHKLTWMPTSAEYTDKEYKITVVEADTLRDDKYNGKPIIFTKEEIRALNAGIYIQKDIGSGYFIGFQKR